MRVDDLLSYGTWEQYRQSHDINLTPQQETQLKSLTVVTLCHNRAVVPYAELQDATDTPTVKELEDLIIHHCIYAGLLSAKLDQRSGQLYVFRASPRKVRPEHIDKMISSLSVWLDQAHKVSYFLDGVGRSLDEATEKTAVAARANILALAAAEKERDLPKSMREGEHSDGVLHGGDVPTKIDVTAKKSKRKKRHMVDVSSDEVATLDHDHGTEDSDS